MQYAVQRAVLDGLGDALGFELLGALARFDMQEFESDFTKLQVAVQS